MIRLTLRQFRTEAMVGLGALAIFGIVLVITGPHLAQVNDAFQRACTSARDCGTATDPVLLIDPELQGLLPLLVTFVPALVGLFLGAPLIARELETGTFRLAWTQSVTLRRWLGVKLAVVGMASVAIGGLLTWTFDWWQGPLDAASQNRFDPVNFGYHGVAPIGYAAFAFALGATAGVLLRRTVPAMGATLVGFIAARLAVEHWIRPHLASPVHKNLSLVNTGFGTMGFSVSAHNFSLYPPSVSIPNGWVMSTAVVDKSGHALTSQYFTRMCPAFGQFPSTQPSMAAVQAAHATCIHKLIAASFHTVVTFQPSSQFWPFQWAEMGMFVAAALALCGVTYWWLRHRYSG